MGDRECLRGAVWRRVISGSEAERGALGRKGGIEGGVRMRARRSVHRFARAVVIEKLRQRSGSAIHEAFGEHMFGFVLFRYRILGEVNTKCAFEGGNRITIAAAVEDLDFTGNFSLLQVFAVGDVDAVFIDLNIHDEVGVEAACEFVEVTPFAVVIEPRGDVIGGDNFDAACFESAGHAIDDIDLDGGIT